MLDPLIFVRLNLPDGGQHAQRIDRVVAVSETKAGGSLVVTIDGPSWNVRQDVEEVLTAMNYAVRVGRGT